jgi:hypothetical protein
MLERRAIFSSLVSLQRWCLMNDGATDIACRHRGRTDILRLIAREETE